MKKAVSILAIAMLALLNPLKCADAQFSKTVTVVSGTRLRVFSTRTMAQSVLVQMMVGGSGYGLVYNANPKGACSAGTLVAQLAPAAATSPGGSYSDGGVSFANNGSIDISWLCVDGSNSGDQILISYRAAN